MCKRIGISRVRPRANPHSERDHHYRRGTHRGECGAVSSFALSKNRSCCGINSDPGPVFRQRRALFREPRRRVESGPGTERRITHSHSFRTRESRASLTRKRFLARTPCPSFAQGRCLNRCGAILRNPAASGAPAGRKYEGLCGGPYRQIVRCWMP